MIHLNFGGNILVSVINFDSQKQLSMSILLILAYGHSIYTFFIKLPCSGNEVSIKLLIDLEKTGHWLP